MATMGQAVISNGLALSNTTASADTPGSTPYNVKSALKKHTTIDYPRVEPPSSINLNKRFERENETSLRNPVPQSSFKSAD